MDILERKIRRSSSLVIPDLFRDYLAYANMIDDQDEVYVYMEENQIGIYEPEYWVARLNYHRNRAEYT